MKHYPNKATQSRLSHANVRTIRRLRKEKGYTYKHLAALYGVSQSSIKDIVLRYTYRYVEDEKE